MPTPVTKPEIESIEATVLLDELHLPPARLLVSVTLALKHT